MSGSIRLPGPERSISSRAAATLTTDSQGYRSCTRSDTSQPVERLLRLTRGILEDLLASGIQPRLTIQTRSPLATRDIDLFRQFEHIRVNVTVTTDDDDVRRRYEPSCPPIEARLDAARAIADAGVPIGLSLSPLLSLRDARAFGAFLATFEADEYVTQYLKLGGGRFVSGTRAAVVEVMRADSWDQRAYRRAVGELRSGLGPRVTLLEGAEGYAPVRVVRGATRRDALRTRRRTTAPRSSRTRTSALLCSTLRSSAPPPPAGQRRRRRSTAT